MDQKKVDELLKTIQEAVDKFNTAVPGFQEAIAKEINLALKDLTTSGDSITASVANIRRIARLRASIEALFRDKRWRKAVGDYVATFEAITQAQNQYFTSLVAEYKPTSVLDAIKQSAIDGAIESLTAVTAKNVSSVVTDLLNKNSTSGASYTELSQLVRDKITNTEAGKGILERYTKQITTDALNQYSAQYTQQVTADLGLEWFVYTGALIESSRVFCEACRKKKYIHISEFDDLVHGNFKQFEDMGGTLNKKTKLPEGMIEGTTAQNLTVYRGGYNCGHQFAPVTAYAVPLDVIAAIPREKLGKVSLRRLSGK